MGLPTVASFLLAWWVIGDLSEDATAPPAVVVPVGPVSSVLLGLAGFALVAAIIADWRRTWGRRLPRNALVLHLLGTMLGTCAALLLRIASLRPAGANMGLGLVVLFSPVLVGLLLGAFVSALVVARRLARDNVGPPAPRSSLTSHPTSAPGSVSDPRRRPHDP